MKLRAILIIGLLFAGLTGCAYGSTLRVGKNKVLVMKNGFYGLTRGAFVCDVNAKGLSNCSQNENP